MTLRSEGWRNGSNVVRASNGEYVQIGLPSFDVSGGDSFNSSHKTTVFFFTQGVTNPLARVEVDATPVYNTGWNDCRSNAILWKALVNYYPVGETLYDAYGNVAVGPWYKGTETYLYALPAAKS